MLQRETDASVLITALNVINFQGEPGPHAASIVTGLDQVIDLHETEYIRGNALLAKARVASSTSDAAVDIRRALKSPLVKTRGYGLRALAHTLERRNNLEETSAFHWTRDRDTRALLQLLIDAPDVDPKSRSEALDLLVNL